jgi:hypothetical protein
MSRLAYVNGQRDNHYRATTMDHRRPSAPAARSLVVPSRAYPQKFPPLTSCNEAQTRFALIEPVLAKRSWLRSDI